MRIGWASDIHRLVENRDLILSGVKIDFPLGELAHSDGDVVYHAVAESILGALALDDLGAHFPDTDPKYKNINSALIVKEVVTMMNEKGYKINNIDISIEIEKPKLRPYIKNMRNNLANLLETSIDNVSIKAGTNEKCDAIGEGIAVRATSSVLLIEK